MQFSYYGNINSINCLPTLNFFQENIISKVNEREHEKYYISAKEKIKYDINEKDYLIGKEIEYFLRLTKGEKYVEKKVGNQTKLVPLNMNLDRAKKRFKLKSYKDLLKKINVNKFIAWYNENKISEKKL